MSIAENLKRLRKQNNFTQQKIAKALNISQQAYAKYELAQAEPDITTIQKLAELFSISVDSLFSENDNKLKSINVIKIPVLGSIPAGIPLEAISDIIDYEEIPEAMAKGGEYFALKVKGDSMSPTILNGDIVIIKKQENAETGDICVFMINGFEATLKEIKKELNGIWVLPHNVNSDFKPTFYSNQEIIETPVNIIGVAVEIRRSLKK